MILKVDDLNLDDKLGSYWNKIRKKNYDYSFEPVREWIITNSKSKLPSGNKNRRNNRLRRALLLFFPLLLLFSCSYRVDRVTPYGDLIKLLINTTYPNSRDQISLLQKTLQISFTEINRKDVPNLTSFIALIKKEPKNKIELIKNKLVDVRGLRTVEISPITYTINESLFSLCFHTVTRRHIDARISDSTKFQKEINNQLEKRGIHNVVVTNIKDGEVVLKSTSEPDIIQSKTDTIAANARITTNKRASSSLSPNKVPEAKVDSLKRVDEYVVVKIFPRSDSLATEEIEGLDYLRSQDEKKINVIVFGWENKQDLVNFFKSENIEVKVERADNKLDVRSNNNNMWASTTDGNVLLILRNGKLVSVCTGKHCADNAAIKFFKLKAET
jgi:hypothetical protein